MAQAQDDVVDPFAAAPDDKPIHQQLKKLFIDGGATFMSLVLLCLILGLAIAISKIITLSIAQNNNTKLLNKIEDCLKNEGVDKAYELCRNTPGPVARIFTQGLLRVRDGQGIEKAEKSVIEYGSVEMGKLEKGLSWIGLFIGIAPQLGFMGTVLGLIQAFDAIEVAGRSDHHRRRSGRRHHPSALLQLHHFQDRHDRRQHGRLFHLARRHAGQVQQIIIVTTFIH